MNNIEEPSSCNWYARNQSANNMAIISQEATAHSLNKTERARGQTVAEREE